MPPEVMHEYTKSPLQVRCSTTSDPKLDKNVGSIGMVTVTLTVTEIIELAKRTTG